MSWFLMRKEYFRGILSVVAILAVGISGISPRLLLAQDVTPPAIAAHPSQADGSARKTRQAIADPQVIDPQGLAKILAKYRGKPLLVNFWATWCEPCRDEYPLLNELAKKYAPQGLQVVGISLDDDGEMILVRRFLARYKPVFPNFRKPPGKEKEFIGVVNQKWNGSIPASFFYARDGRQLGQIIGEGKRDIFEAAIHAVLTSGAKDSANAKSGSAGTYR
jgi:thiol-disulfide isomerase/thioredoxin